MTREAARWKGAQLLALPVAQVKFLDELTEEQVQAVRMTFSMGLVNCGAYLYGVRRDGSLVPNRERIRPEWG